MRPADLLRHSLENLADRKLRTALTLCGIVIGVAALASLQSFAEGARANVLGLWESTGATSQILVMPRGEDPWPSRRRRAAAGDDDGTAASDAPARRLDEAALEELRALPGVRLVAVPVLRPVVLHAGERRASSLLLGLPPELPGGEGLYRLQSGSHLPAAAGPDGDDGPPGILLGKRLAGDLGLEAGAAVGRTVEAVWEEMVRSAGAGPLGLSLEERRLELRVAGLVDGTTAYVTVGPFNAVVPRGVAAGLNPASLEALRAMAGEGGHPSATAFLDPGAPIEEVEKKIQELGFSARTALEFLSGIRRGLLLVQALLGCLGGVALAVAGLGIANTFLTAVYERTHEIGVRRAVGARRADIRRQFLFEAGFLGFAGGLAGLGLAWIANRYLATAVFLRIARDESVPANFYVFTPRLVAGSLLFAVAISLAASLYPASRAARLDPVESLRHE